MFSTVCRAHYHDIPDFPVPIANVGKSRAAAANETGYDLLFTNTSSPHYSHIPSQFSTTALRIISIRDAF